jgi:Trk K+ transport system NAD-binding subunit
MDEIIRPPAGGERALILIVGEPNSLTLRVCAEISRLGMHRPSVMTPAAPDFAAQVRRLDARFVPYEEHGADALIVAGVAEAASLIALSQDDRFNLQIALRARDLNPQIRLVLRQFNRTLGHKIAQNLHNCSVLSLASHSAATYAAAAVDQECFSGVEFPDGEGPLLGFATRGAEETGTAGLTLEEAEHKLGARIVAVDGAPAGDAGARIPPGGELITCAAVVPGRANARSASDLLRMRRSRHAALAAIGRAVGRLDVISRGLIAFALALVALGTIFFCYVLNLDPLGAFYLVIQTMTNTGFDDRVVRAHGREAEIVAIGLMLSGLVLSGLFIAIVASRLTQAEFILSQGLRRIERRGHVIVCGAGQVGSQVIEYLLELDRQVIAIDVRPTDAIVELSRRGEIDLLTGDATAEKTLELCSLQHAAALVALTESDTMNLEVALGARARNATLPVVMRIGDAAFASSIGRHFGIETTFATAGLAAPAFAGLAANAGSRGRVTIGDQTYGVHERLIPPGGDLLEREIIPLWAWRGGRLVAVRGPGDVRDGDRVLSLMPLAQFRRERFGLPPGIGGPRYDAALYEIDLGR